jgi:hypothetical protein
MILELPDRRVALRCFFHESVAVKATPATARKGVRSGADCSNATPAAAPATFGTPFSGSMSGRNLNSAVVGIAG